MSPKTIASPNAAINNTEPMLMPLNMAINKSCIFKKNSKLGQKTESSLIFSKGRSP